MKFEIFTLHSGNCYIGIGHKQFDREVAKYLNLTTNEYTDILKQHKASINSISCDGEYKFKNERDAKRAIKVLEPYLIMAELTR